MTRPFPLLLALLFPSALLAQGKLARPVIDKLPGGVPRVMNPGPTRWADTNGWKLVYERTVQPPEGAPGTFDAPFSTLLATDGRLITVDDVRPAIRLYDANGKFLRLLGRAGEGPGEFRHPFAALDHDTLFFHDPGLRRLTVMTLDGKLVRTEPTTANDYFPIAFDARGRMATRYSVRTPGGMKGRWVYQTRKGSRADSIYPPGMFPDDLKSWSYPSPEGTGEMMVPFQGRNNFYLLPSGGAVWGRTDRYAMVVTRSGSDTTLLFGRTNPPAVRIPESRRDSAFDAAVTWRASLRTTAKKSDIPTVYPLWRTLESDAMGNIWVSAPASQPDQTRFDVFSPAGVFLGAVAAPFASTAPVTFTGDRVSVIDTDENDLPRVRIFRIERKGR